MIHLCNNQEVIHHHLLKEVIHLHKEAITHRGVIHHHLLREAIHLHKEAIHLHKEAIHLLKILDQMDQLILNGVLVVVWLLVHSIQR